MNTMNTTLLFAYFLVFFLTTDAYLIFDINGNVLRNNGGPYRLASFIGSAPSDEVMLATGTCPLDVIQGPCQAGVRHPFVFASMLRIAIIDSSYPLIIRSPIQNPCNQSTIWRVDNRNGGIITTGGNNHSGYCFRISRHPNPSIPMRSYMLEYCPSLCGRNTGGGRSETCFPVRISTKDGKKHLASNSLRTATARPFEFVFRPLSRHA